MKKLLGAMLALTAFIAGFSRAGSDCGGAPAPAPGAMIAGADCGMAAAPAIATGPSYVDQVMTNLNWPRIGARYRVATGEKAEGGLFIPYGAPAQDEARPVSIQRKALEHI